MKYIIRIYDPELDNCLRMRYEQNKRQFQSMNAMLTDLIEAGLRQSSPASSCENGGIEEEAREIIKLLKSLTDDNKTVKSLLSSVYALLLAHNDEAYLSRSQVEAGFYDKLPDRFTEKK